MYFERICTSCGQPTNSLSCILCAQETQVRSATTDEELLNESAIFSPADPASQRAPEVIYLRAQDLPESSLRARVLRSFYLYAMPILSAWLAITNHLRVLFTVATVFGLQLIYLRLRTRRLTGPVIDDATLQSRVTPPLLELCALAGLPAPKVRIQKSMILIGMTSYKKEPLLCISTEFLEAADDGVLRAVIAHELMHQKNADVAAARSRAISLGLGFYLFFLAIDIPTAHGSLIDIAAYFAFQLPVLSVASWATGFSWRKRETLADLESVALANDPESFVRGLRLLPGLASQRRRNVFGSKSIRWLLFPFSLRPTTHPPSEERVAAIRAKPLSENRANVESGDVHGTRTIRKRLMAGAVVLITLIGLVAVIHHATTHSLSISARVESPEGAHFIPVNDMGIPSPAGLVGLTWHFFPLTHEQSHHVSLTAKQALAIAKKDLGVHAGDGVTSIVAEGSWAGVSILGFDSDPPPTVADGTPVYLVAFRGTDFKDPGTSGIHNLCVVVVRATGGHVASKFYYSPDQD